MRVIPDWLFSAPALTALTLLGSLSPLLTSARLFQMKEWRLDRLMEHLHREGLFTSLIGRARGFVIGAYGLFVIGGLIMLEMVGGGGMGFFAVMWLLSFVPWWLILLAAVCVGQIAAKKQPVPVLTTKALLLMATAFLLTGVTAYACFFQLRILLLPLIPVLQPIFLLVSWILWRPLDWFLKQRLLSRAARRRSTLKDSTVIGIAGSVGKTTTKELLKCVLADLSPITTPEHVNTELGVSAWMLRNVPRKTKKPFLIVEMGAYRKGEIALLCRIAQPTVGVVTALGSDHLALFGSEEAIVEANAELLDALPKDGTLFLLGDSKPTKALAKRAECAVITAGSADTENVRETDRGLTIESDGSRFNIALNGLHNVGNVMLAVAVARHFGIQDERIRELLASFRGAAHTFRVRTERGVTILDDTYNVSPLSFRAALDWTKSRSERPRVLLTSGLLETGKDEARFLNELGTAAKKSVDRVVFTVAHGAKEFEAGYGKQVEILGSETKPVQDDSLLICVGRMPLFTIQKLLP